MLAHIAAVTDVRLDVADRHAGAEWVCERELHPEAAPDAGGGARPRPGAPGGLDGREVAVRGGADRHAGAEWVCERELHREAAADASGRQRHRPDALVVLDGREVAVEVELTLKRRARMERIMRELVARYGSVSYFAAPAAR